METQKGDGGGGGDVPNAPTLKAHYLHHHRLLLLIATCCKMCLLRDNQTFFKPREREGKTYVILLLMQISKLVIA